MQVLGKILLLIVVACYVTTIYAESNTVVDGATHIKDTVSDGVETGAKVTTDAVKNAG